jgi:hypothetical protein
VLGLAATVALLIAACSGAAGHRQAATDAVAFTGPARSIPPDFVGVNGEGITTDLLARAWHAAGFAASVAALRPGNIRVFGGTSAQLWSWTLGRLVQSGPSGSGYKAGEPSPAIHLSDIAAVVRASGATPLFDLNMVTSTLPDQLAMLRAAQAAGLQVRRVELGNELWAPDYAKQFPSGRAYALVANRWIATLHEAFPGVEVAVDVDTLSQVTNDRGQNWNAEVLGAMDGADAVSVHQYVHTSATAPAGVVAAVDDAWTTSLQPTLSALPPGLPVWLTEWNYAPLNPATISTSTPTGAEAIGNALLATLVASDPRITLADFHALAGWTGSPFAAVLVQPDDTARANLHYRLSPSGAVLQSVMAALDGCTAVRPIGGTPAITGLVCLSSEKPRVLLVNVSGQRRVIDLQQVDPGRRARADTLVVDPHTTSSATPTRRVDEAAPDRLTVPGWSVVLVSG